MTASYYACAVKAKRPKGGVSHGSGSPRVARVRCSGSGGMSCLVTPAGGPSSPVGLLPDVAPGGKLSQQSPGVVDLVPDSLLGVISSGIRCVRTFCEHLTALYPLESSNNTQ